jgi:hypothetical protein
MRKNQIEVGGRYAAARGRYASPRQYEVVENTEYHSRTGYNLRNALPREALRADKAYRKAHLAWALTEAFKLDTTPKEAQAAARALEEAVSGANQRWLDADPMRRFAPGRGMGGSRWNRDESGILCRSVSDDGGLDDGLVLVERRDIISTWDDYQTSLAEEKKAAARAVKAREAAQKQAARDLADLKAFLIDVLGFEVKKDRTYGPELTPPEGIPAVVVSDYSRKPLEYLGRAEALTLLRAVYAKGQVNAALATTKKEGQTA